MITTPEQASSKWYELSNMLAKQQLGAGLDANAMAAGRGLYGGLSGLAQRGANAGGSLERAATMGMTGMGAGGLEASQAAMGGLAQNIAKGIQGIDLPTLQGRDMAAAQKYASDIQAQSGLGGMFSRLLGG